MKKLMIAAVAVAMAAVAPAATSNWKISPSGTLKDGFIKYTTPSATSSSMSAIGGATVYLIAATVSYDESTGQTALLKALRAGESLSSYAYKDGNPEGAIFVTTDNSDTTAKGTVPSASAATFTSEKYDTSATVGFFLATIATDATGNEFVFLSATANTTVLDDKKVTGPSLAMGMSTNYRTTTDFGSAGWYLVEAAPEPTSGLLLLIGVGALALRRKRV